MIQEKLGLLTVKKELNQLINQMCLIDNHSTWTIKWN